MADDLQRRLAVETNERFWARTGYKRGHRLERSDPMDRQMMSIWIDTYREVLREYGESQAHPPAPGPLPVPAHASLPPPIEAPADEHHPIRAVLLFGGLAGAAVFIGRFVRNELKFYQLGRRIERGAR